MIGDGGTENASLKKRDFILADMIRIGRQNASEDEYQLWSDEENAPPGTT